MAVYCTRADINLDPARLAELTDSAGLVGIIDANVEAQVFDDASRELDGYLEATYAVPIEDPVPAIIRTWTAVIARWRLYGRRPEMDPPKAIQIDYERTIKLAMASGMNTEGCVVLPLARVSGPTAPRPSDALVVEDFRDPRRVFGRFRDR